MSEQGPQFSEKELREFSLYEVIDHGTDKVIGQIWYLKGKVHSDPAGLKDYAAHLMANKTDKSLKDGVEFMKELPKMASSYVGVRKVHG